MQDALDAQKQRTVELQAVVVSAKEDLEEVRRRHPEDMHRTISELEETFTRAHLETEEELKRADEENKQLKEEMRKHHTELELWYPGFPLYQDSYIKNHIPQRLRAQGSMIATASTLSRVEEGREE